MGETRILNEGEVNELVMILESYGRNSEGKSGVIIVNPKDIFVRRSDNTHVLLSYDGKNIYLFRGQEPNHVEEMLRAHRRMKSEGFRAYRGMNPKRVYLIVDVKNSV